MWEIIDGMYAPYLTGETLTIEGDINSTRETIIATWETTPDRFQEVKDQVCKDLGINLESIPSKNNGLVLCSFGLRGSYLKMKN